MENAVKTVEYPFFAEKPVENHPFFIRCTAKQGALLMNKKQKKTLERILIAVALVIVLKLLPALPMPVELALYAAFVTMLVSFMSMLVHVLENVVAQRPRMARLI